MFEDAEDWLVTPTGGLLHNDRTPKWRPRIVEDKHRTYHTETRLPNGTNGLLVDPDLIHNSSGSEWSTNIAAEAIRHLEVPRDELPELHGLTSMTTKRFVLDNVTKQLHFLGPGDYDLATALPPGKEIHQLTTMPLSQLIQPCSHYREFDNQQRTGSLTLDQENVSLVANSTAEEFAAGAMSDASVM